MYGTAETKDEIIKRTIDISWNRLNNKEINMITTQIIEASWIKGNNNNSGSCLYSLSTNNLRDTYTPIQAAVQKRTPLILKIGLL